MKDSTAVQEGKRYQPCYALFKEGEEIYRGGSWLACYGYLRQVEEAWLFVGCQDTYAIKEITP